MVVIWLTITGLGRLRLPRWSLSGVAALLALAGLPLGLAMGNFLFATFMCMLGLGTLMLVAGAVVGRIAARGGARRDGDIAMAIFAGYAIGQFMPLFYGHAQWSSGTVRAR